ncbi:MAG: hypothetical protein FGM24_02100 [Candidatus Kapabacteria bacterium]|nr:hypothetical protein [Candidatus Kapabacteria bacterium]
MRAALIALLLAGASAFAEIPQAGLAVWWRADRGVTTVGDLVTSWESGDRIGGLATAVGESQPRLVDDAVNGHDAVRFDAGASTYLDGPSRFPVNSDYTIYVVLRLNNTAPAGNIIGGTSRTLWMGSSDKPRVLHAGDFGNQAVSDVGIGVGSFAVVRVVYKLAENVATIHVNNVLGAGESYVPVNNDPKIFLGAYQASNFLSADIAEVAIYGRALAPLEVQEADIELHNRYGIVRAPDPEPPVIAFDVVPKPLALYAEGQDMVCSGTVVDGAVRKLSVELDSAGKRAGSWQFDVRTTPRFSFQRTLQPGLHAYTLRFITEDNVGRDTVHSVDEIVCGEVIAIEGQSNSIFPDATLPVSPWARTFGSNFGQAASDTTFKRSVATDGGGGANVGGIGMYLQNAFATEFQRPTCVINGGVGGTRIEQHFPNGQNRLDRTTIYGSWAYRLKQSGLAPYVRLLIWYQGESNGGGDRYGELFDKLYREWREELPNLERIIVIQIRPGCGGTQHAKLRHDQMELGNGRYPDVYVHAAAGLPGHDGCHYTPAGYQTLGRQLMDIIKANRASLGDGFTGTAPVIQQATADVRSDGTVVTLTFSRTSALRFTTDTAAGGEIRYSKDAFFLNGEQTEHPSSAIAKGNTVELRVPSGVSVSSVSYVPDTQYPGTDAVFQGPWLVTDAGIGALTFYNVAVTTTSVAADARVNTSHPRVMRAGDELAVDPTASPSAIWDVQGSLVALVPATDGSILVPSLPPGVYVVRGGKGRWFTVVP